MGEKAERANPVTRSVLPWILIPLLTVLVLVPVGFMFLGAFMSGALVDPQAHLTMDKIRAVYTTMPYLRSLSSTIVIALLVAVVSSLGGVAMAWLTSRTDLPAAPSWRRA